MANGIERHVTFHALPDKLNEFVRFFEQEYRPAMAKTEGFLKADLLKDTENTLDVKMVLRFDSLESAAAWRASDIHTALKPRLKALYSGSELEVYEVLV
jgi:heme-degrading monooxygenase HmoA